MADQVGHDDGVIPDIILSVIPGLTGNLAFSRKVLYICEKCYHYGLDNAHTNGLPLTARTAGTDEMGGSEEKCFFKQMGGGCGGASLAAEAAILFVGYSHFR